MNVVDLPQFTPRAVTLPGNIATVCTHYLAQLSARGYSPHTVSAYTRDLEQFAGYLAGRDVTQIQIVPTAMIDDFVDALVMGEGVSRRTAARKLETVKGLFRYAVGRGLIPGGGNPAERAAPVRFQARRIVAPEESAILRMIDAIPADTLTGVRDRALFRLMFDAALRVGGIISLDVYRADNPPECCVDTRGVVSYRAKGGAVKSSLADDATLAALAAWLKVRYRFVRANSPDALFLTERGARMTRAGIHRQIKTYGRAAGMPHVHSHLLRHRRIGEVLDRTDLRTANYLAGHERLSTTADIYGDAPAERLRARIRRECPVGVPRRQINQEDVA